MHSVKRRDSCVTVLHPGTNPEFGIFCSEVAHVDPLLYIGITTQVLVVKMIHPSLVNSTG